MATRPSCFLSTALERYRSASVGKNLCWIDYCSSEINKVGVAQGHHIYILGSVRLLLLITHTMLTMLSVTEDVKLLELQLWDRPHQ